MSQGGVLFSILAGTSLPAPLVLLADSYASFPVRLYNTLTLNRAVLDAANIKLRVYYSKR